MRKHGRAVLRTGRNFKRRSVMGTKGYMAPEMAKLLNQVGTHGDGHRETLGYRTEVCESFKRDGLENGDHARSQELVN